MICGRRFSFITIASIDFWSDLQLIFCISMHAFCRVSYAILWYTRYAYGVWFLMVWPWFGHSSLNHNEYAVSSAVSRMKMPPVREHASSLLPHSGPINHITLFLPHQIYYPILALISYITPFSPHQLHYPIHAT